MLFVLFIYSQTSLTCRCLILTKVAPHCGNALDWLPSIHFIFILLSYHPPHPVCMEQPVVFCQECTVADDVLSMSWSLYFCSHRFRMTRRSWLFWTVVCLRLLTVGASVRVFVLYNFVWCPCNVFVTLISALLLTLSSRPMWLVTCCMPTLLSCHHIS